MDMSRHQDDYPRWVAIDAEVIAKVQGSQVTGLLVYGTVSAERLRSIKLKHLNYIAGPSVDDTFDSNQDGSILVPHNFPEWRQEHPPSPEQVRMRTKDLKLRGPGRLVPTGRWRPTAPQRATIIKASTKREGESATDFYRRFASMVQEISPRTDSPNQVIAQVAGISDDVVKQYMHRARKIGALPAARRRKT